MKNTIEKLQKKHSETLEFYSSEKLTEREQNLLRSEMSFLIEITSELIALDLSNV